MKRTPKLVMENVEIRWKNFKGAPDKYHPDGGYRQFTVVIPTEELADELTADGWNVRFRPGREEGDPDIYTLSVQVSYRNRPPHIFMIFDDGHRVDLDEDSVEVLDDMYINSADVVISPYHHDNNGGGISAYCATLAALVEEDAIMRKYSNRG